MRTSSIKIIDEIYAPQREMSNYMFGKLTLRCLSTTKPVKTSPSSGMVFGGIALIGLITYLKRWKWLWNEWLTTVDPKRIGIMYIVVVLIMFLKGFADALMMRLQQALSVGDAHGFISSGHFQEVFSAHGTTMIFFVGMGVVFGLDESHHSFANWGQGCRFPLFKCRRFLAFCSRGEP